MIKPIYEIGKIYPVIKCIRDENKVVDLGTPVVFIAFNNNTVEQEAIVKDFNGNKFTIPISALSEYEIEKYPNKFEILKSKVTRNLFYYQDTISSFFMGLTIMLIIAFVTLLISAALDINSKYDVYIAFAVTSVVLAIISFISSLCIDSYNDPDENIWTFAFEYNRNELHNLLNCPKYEIRDKEGNLVDVALAFDTGIISNVPLGDGSYKLTEI